MSNESENTITLANGAVIWFKSAENPDSLYGEDVWACVIDEASRVKEESWHAVRSTLTATQGKLRIIGNVKGRRNWAYNMARKAETGEPNMTYHKITAYNAIQAKVLKTEEVEDAKRQLPEAVFKELYLAEPSDDEGNPFGIKAIKDCIKQVSVNAPQVYGIDLAKSVDFTVIIGLDNTRQLCKFERFQSPWQETMNRIKTVIGNQRAIVDSTGVGDPIVEQLKRAGLHVEGYKFTQTSKQQLMEGLAYAIQQHVISFPEGVITNELNAFEYEYTRTGVKYSAPEGLHDDCVCALALANNGFRRAPAEIRWI